MNQEGRHRMEASDTIETPVLIAGAGPAGLAAAATLAQHGVASITVEKRAAPNPIPRATVLSTRTMELVRAWGLEEQVLLGAADVEWLLWRCETLAQVGEGH